MNELVVAQVYANVRNTFSPGFKEYEITFLQLCFFDAAGEIVLFAAGACYGEAVEAGEKRLNEAGTVDARFIIAAEPVTGTIPAVDK